MKTLLLTFLLSSNIFASEVISIEKLTSLSPIDTLPKCSIHKLYKADKSKLFAKNAVRINHIFNAIKIVAKKLNVDPCLIVSMVGQESSFKANRTSIKGAKGLMQVMPLTRTYILKTLLNDSKSIINKKQYNKILSKLNHRLLSKEENENLLLGSVYFAYLLNKFKGNSYHAVMAYNMGSGWVNRNLNNKVKIGVNNNYLNKIYGIMEIIANN